MRVIRLWAFVLFFSLASCAANRIRSSYQIYPLQAPSMAKSFANTGPQNANALVKSYQADSAAPIRLTTSDGTGLDLRELRVRSVVNGPLAFTELKMTFHNPRNRELEGRFEITLPDNASVARLAMKRNSHWQEAEVVARRRGQEVYERYLHKQVDPVLLEASVGNQFRARVYPIAAKGDKEIIISYSEVLPASGEYRLLLAGLSTVAKLDVDVHHGASRERFIRPDFVGTRDLVVATTKAKNTAVRGGELVMMRWVPTQSIVDDAPKQLHVLVDSSASSAGVYGNQVRAVQSLAAALASTYGDSFVLDVACYDNQVTEIYRGPAKGYGSEESAALLTHGALGATNISGALRWIAKRKGRFLLIGDGIATAEQRNWSGMRGSLKDSRPERVDVLAFSNAKNATLLQELAQQSGQRAGVLLSSSQQPAQWLRQLAHLAPEEIAIDVAGASWVWPKKIRSTRAGEAVTAFAKFEKAGADRLESIRVEETRGDATESVELAVDEGEVELVKRVWVQMQLRLLAKLQREKHSDVRESLIETLSHRYRVMTPTTSYLMLESDSDYQRFGIDRSDSDSVLVVDATGLRNMASGGGRREDWQWNTVVKAPFEKGLGAEESSQGSASMEVQVRDKNTGEPLAGVTMIATSDATQNNYNAISDGSGRLSLANLPIGSYSMLLIYGNVKMVYDTIEVEPGATARIFAKMDLSALAGETIAIRGRALIDTTTTSQGVVIRKESVENLPVPGRTFESVLSTAAGAQNDGVGVSFSGSSSLENQYVVDGVNTTGLSRGTVKVKRGKEITSVDRPKKDSADIKMFRKIRRLLRGQRAPRALTLALHWYSDTPANLLAVTALGEALQASGHYVLATRAYASILDLYPSRADMHRVAAGYLGLLGASARPLRVDALRFAHEARPDHVHGIGLLAMEYAMSGQEEKAIRLLLATLAGSGDTLGRLNQIRELLRHEVGMIAAAWLSRVPESAAKIKELLGESGIMVPMQAARYVLLTWESDVARLNLEVYPTHGDGTAKGSFTRIGEIGYGPEAFVADENETAELSLSAVFEEQAMTGYAFAQMQVVHLDDEGRLHVETRPFVALQEQEQVSVGGF